MHKYVKYHIKESLKVMSQRNTLWDYMVGRVASCNAICHQWQIFTWESCPGAIIKVQCCNNKVFNEVSLFKFPYIIYYVTCFVILYSVFVIYSFWSHRHFVWYFQRSWHCLSPESEWEWVRQKIYKLPRTACPRNIAKSKTDPRVEWSWQSNYLKETYTSCKNIILSFDKQYCQL